MTKYTSSVFAILFIALLWAVPASFAKGDSHTSIVRQTLVVNALQKSCWDAIRNPLSCPDKRRVLSVADNNAMVEETFLNLPLIHTSTCVFKETETPFQRIDFDLVKSSHFKAMYGAYILHPIGNDKTMVEIQSSLDTGIRLPFAKKVTTDYNEKKCKDRLAIIKTIAEAAEQKATRISQANVN